MTENNRNLALDMLRVISMCMIITLHMLLHGNLLNLLKFEGGGV